MSAAMHLLDRVVESVKEEQSFIHLGRIFDPLRCARFPPAERVRVGRLQETAAHYRVLEAADIHEFHYRKREQWAPYDEIAAAYGHGSSNIAKLSPSLVEAPVKLVIADRTSSLRCFVTAERIYPKRAWIGALAAGWNVEMAFVVAGILNSAIGHVLYTRTASRVGISGNELAMSVLEGLSIPAPSLQPEAFSQLALISYRLHRLYEAQSACGLNLDHLIRNHWLYLLPQVVKLYGWSEPDARMLLLEAPETRDQMAARDHLYSTWPQAPLQAIRLLDGIAEERYEDLKSQRRAGLLAPGEAAELARLEEAIHWESRINGEIPSRLPTPSWPGAANEQQALRIAYGHLSRTRGQRFGAEHPVRKTERLWEVPVYYSPPRVLTEEDAGRLPKGWSQPGKHPAGKLYVDAITGEVSDTLESAQHAVAHQSG